MAKAIRFISFVAPLLISNQGCDTPGQKDKTALETSSPHIEVPSKAATDSSLASIPNAMYEMPAMRGKMLATLVDCNELALLLPEALPNMKRDDLFAERAVDDSVLISQATGSYADAAGNNIEIKIMDSGDLKVYSPSVYPWLRAEVRSETATGYERSISFEGYRGFERYYLKDHSGEMYVAVSERFVVEITGYGVLSEDLKNAVHRIDLRKLEGMKKATGQPFAVTGQ